MNLTENNLSNKLRFILIAYKPSSDTWDGCSADHYSSDRQIQSTDSEDNLIDMIAVFQAKNLNLRYEEDGYEFTIIDNGEIIENIQPYLDLASIKAEEANNIRLERERLEEEENRRKRAEREIQDKRNQIALLQLSIKRISDSFGIPTQKGGIIPQVVTDAQVASPAQ